ncbi:MAG: SulP family inorganic anion transporter [Deinococcales bacterium]
MKPLSDFKPPQLGDLLAGLSVALIIMPQAIAYAELAGLSPVIGLAAAAFPAIVAAFFVSSPYLQTGPTAMTSLLTFATLSHLAPTQSANYIALAALLALLVGIIRIAIGRLGLGAVAYLISQPVLLGFSTGAAILIVASQLPSVFGYRSSAPHVILGAWDSLIHMGQWQLEGLILSLLAFALILGGRRFHALFPGVLVAVVLTSLYSYYRHFEGQTLGHIEAAWPQLQLIFPWEQIPNLILSAMVIAVIGFAEVAAIARSYATQERQIWDANREFISQGMANLAAAFCGAFPVGGSFSRSALNHLAGAKTRWSGAFTGFLTLGLLPLAPLLSSLPKSVLAAIIIASVLKLISIQALIKMWRYSHSQSVIAWVSFASCLLFSPRVDIAVIIGVSLSIAHHLRREQQHV